MVQVASKHPQLEEPGRRFAQAFQEQLLARVGNVCPAVAEILRRGMTPPSNASDWRKADA
jgi:hypothetical protein